MNQLRGGITLPNPKQKQFQDTVERVVFAKRSVLIKLKDQEETVIHKDVQMVNADGLFYTVILEGLKEIYKYPSQNISSIREVLKDD